MLFPKSVDTTPTFLLTWALMKATPFGPHCNPILRAGSPNILRYDKPKDTADNSAVAAARRILSQIHVHIRLQEGGQFRVSLNGQKRVLLTIYLSARTIEKDTPEVAVLIAQSTEIQRLSPGVFTTRRFFFRSPLRKHMVLRLRSSKGSAALPLHRVGYTF